MSQLRASSCSCRPLNAAIRVGPVQVDLIGSRGALDRLAVMAGCPATHVINHIPADPVIIARRDDDFREALNRADLNVPDGMGVVWACRLLGASQLRERVYGPDFMQAALDSGREHKVRHYFYGATPEVLSTLVSNVSRDYPGIEIVGFHAPPFRPLTGEEERETAERINEASPHILWVGIGTPRQQFFADRFRSLVDVRVIVTVGAAFDFLSGEKPQAPVWMRKRGLEWAFRLATEPRRLWRRYLIGLPKFAAVVVADAAANRMRRIGERRR